MSKTNEELVLEIRDGVSVTDNMQALYLQNLPLLKQFVKPYEIFESRDDLLQESYFGLSEAIRHYDRSAGVQFMTYAKYWVVQHIQRHIQKTAAIPIPAYLSEKIVRYKKTVQQYLQTYGTEPTDSELAGLLGISLEKLRKIQSYVYRTDILNLDAPLQDEDSLTVGDSIAADYDLESNVIDSIYESFTAGILDEAVSGLDEMQRLIVRKIFFEGQSIADVARESGIQYQTVRKLKHEALRKLSRNKRLRQQLETVDANAYRSGLRSFKRHNETSITEFVAIRHVEIEGLLDK